MAKQIYILIGAATLAGCQAPWIQTPSLMPSNPAAERASYTYHDPLPDSSAGPSTGGRPREASIQRSEPRRTLEAAIPSMTYTPVPGGGGPPMPGPPGSYPNAISP